MADFLDSIRPQYEQTNFSEFSGITDLGLQDNPDTIWLVLFNAQSGNIFVDERAPEWYKRLAAFHEEICIKHLHEELISDLTSDSTRCSKIEKHIISRLPKHLRYEYTMARRKMFRFLLENGLADPKLKETFLNSLEVLK